MESGFQQLHFHVKVLKIFSAVRFGKISSFIEDTRPATEGQMIQASADLNLRVSGLLIAQVLDAIPLSRSHSALSSISDFVLTGSVSVFVPKGSISALNGRNAKSMLFAKLGFGISRLTILTIPI